MLAPEFPALIEAYDRECRVEGLPPPLAKLETYREYEGAGFLHAFAAVQDEALVGFVTVAAYPLPHYSAPIAVVESFFVDPGHRGLIGLQLLQAAEKQALASKSPVLQICTPVGSRLCQLLERPKLGYRATNVVYTKGLGHAH